MSIELNQFPIKLTLNVYHGLGEDLDQLNLNNLETNHCLSLSKSIFRAITALANGKEEIEEDGNLDITNLSIIGIALIEKLEDTIDLNELNSFNYEKPSIPIKLNGNGKK